MTKTPTGSSKPQKRRQVTPGLWQLNTDLYEIRVRAISPTTGQMVSRWRRFEGTRIEPLAERERLRESLTTNTGPTPTCETLSTFARYRRRQQAAPHGFVDACEGPISKAFQGGSATVHGV